MDYLTFVEKRHLVWELRQAGSPQPWTDDPIIASRKFTNVYRLLDPGSQFVITDLLEPDLPVLDYLMRCFLYRHTNLPSAWRAFRNDTGHYPLMEDVDDGTLLDSWQEHKAAGGRIFSGAYMIYPQSATPGTDKMVSIIELTNRLFLEKSLGTTFVSMRTQAERFAVLRSNKGVADFMSMQILTDYGYSTEDRENEFVVAGPGAVKGAAVLGMKPLEAIRWAHPLISDLHLGNRPPSLMDVQNTFCEFSKYARLTPSLLHYIPAHPGPQPKPVLPPLWKD